jgi:hypothetical protein
MTLAAFLISAHAFYIISKSKRFWQDPTKQWWDIKLCGISNKWSTSKTLTPADNRRLRRLPAWLTKSITFSWAIEKWCHIRIGCSASLTYHILGK